jgi:predicted DNA-binding transcriptional regulator AlpA
MPENYREDMELLKPGQVLARLNISRGTLYKFVQCGLLERMMLPNGHSRYRRSQVESLLSGWKGASPPAPGGGGASRSRAHPPLDY